MYIKLNDDGLKVTNSTTDKWYEVVKIVPTEYGISEYYFLNDIGAKQLVFSRQIKSSTDDKPIQNVSFTNDELQ